MSAAQMKPWSMQCLEKYWKFASYVVSVSADCWSALGIAYSKMHWEVYQHMGRKAGTIVPLEMMSKLFFKR
jgi:hypothetical protein